MKLELPFTEAYATENTGELAGTWFVNIVGGTYTSGRWRETVADEMTKSQAERLVRKLLALAKARREAEEYMDDVAAEQQHAVLNG